MFAALGRGGLLALWLVAPSPSPEPEGAVPGKTLKTAIQHYRDALARARWSPGYGSLGGLYGQARSFGPERSAALAAETRDYLQKATPEQKSQFLANLEGLYFTTAEAPPIPDLAFIQDLNRTSKERESERFFPFLQKLYSRTFVRPYEGKGGCTLLGNGQVVGVARSLKAIEPHVPHYKAFIQAEHDAVLKALMTPCACLTAAESSREITAYMKAFPKDPALPDLADQLQKIDAKDPTLHFQCGEAPSPSPPSPSPASPHP
jgi:hypothetical protein